MLTSGTWNLILACMWLVLSAALFIVDPKDLRLTRVGLDISLGWITLLLTAWNAVRWWGLHSAYQRRRATEELERHRRSPRRAEPEQERNPDFIFDEPPPEKPS